MREVRDRLRVLDQIRAPDLRERSRSWEPPVPRTEPSLKRAGIAILAFVVAAAGIAFAIRAFRAAEPIVRPATTIENGKIAFVSDGINLMNPDGTGAQKIHESDPRDFDTRPVWSLDGTRIAFLHKVEGRFELLVFDVVSGSVTTVAGREFDVDSPQWSPNGTMITFVSGNDLFLINEDGTGATRLTTGAFPTWSPDGTRIAFQSQLGISVINVDGSGETDLAGDGFFPAWSPSEARIAFIDANLQVGVVNADGTGLTQLTNMPNDDPGRPAWSPDGSEIAFEALWEGNYDIYLVNADGPQEPDPGGWRRERPDVVSRRNQDCVHRGRGGEREPRKHRDLRRLRDGRRWHEQDEAD
jgi:Tol biopolymer transport system component